MGTPRPWVSIVIKAVWFWMIWGYHYFRNPHLHIMTYIILLKYIKHDIKPNNQRRDLPAQKSMGNSQTLPPSPSLKVLDLGQRRKLAKTLLRWQCFFGDFCESKSPGFWWFYMVLHGSIGFIWCYKGLMTEFAGCETCIQLPFGFTTSYWTVRWQRGGNMVSVIQEKRVSFIVSSGILW